MILVGGENLIDFVQVKSPQIHLLYQAIPGGSPYNCARAIACQDIEAGYLTPISSDTFGDLLAKGLSDAGADLCAPRREEPTSLAIVSHNNGQPIYQFYRENTAERMVSFNQLNQHTPANVSAFHLGSLSIADGEDAEIWTEYFVSQKQKQVFTSLDPNIRPAFISNRGSYEKRFNRLLAETDLLKLSDEDLAWLYPDVALYEAAQHLLERSSANLLIVTLGSEGAFALSNRKTIQIPAAPVKNIEDTIGTGDIFMATLLAELSRSKKLNSKALKLMAEAEVVELLERAALAAALNCEAPGCNPPSLEELNNRWLNR